MAGCLARVCQGDMVFHPCRKKRGKDGAPKSSLASLCSVLVDQPLVQSNRLVRDRRPGELLLDALASGYRRTCRAFSGSAISSLIRAARSRENFSGSEGNFVTGSWSNVNQVAGLVIDHHFEDSAGGAGHHRSVAGHRFQVDDAERLVDRRAAEDPAVAVELNGLGLRVTIFSIHTTCGLTGLTSSTFARISAAISGVSGAPAHSTTWVLLGHVTDSVHEMRHALLPRNPPHEQHVRQASDPPRT